MSARVTCKQSLYIGKELLCRLVRLLQLNKYLLGFLKKPSSDQSYSSYKVAIGSCKIHSRLGLRTLDPETMCSDRNRLCGQEIRLILKRSYRMGGNPTCRSEKHGEDELLGFEIDTARNNIISAYGISCQRGSD